MEQKYVHFLWIFYLCCWLHSSSVNGQSNGDLRLSLGNEGLLEIYYDGTWGYVCSDGWNDKDSSVACRNLGFGSVKAFQSSYYHPNLTNEEFKINDVNCTGNENSLLNCDYTYTVTNCYYYRHIYLDCTSDHCQSYLHNAEYSAQLVRYFNGVDWFYICKDNFSEKNAHVICYENYGTEALNYTFLSSSSLTANYSFYPYQFNCKGEEASLCNCPTVNQTCVSSEFVAVLCKKEVVSEGTIRLTSGDERFLQAYINSGWIFVCTYGYYGYSYYSPYYSVYSDGADSNYFLSHAMDIACKELGYSKVKSFQLNYDYIFNQQNSLHLGFCPRNVTKLSDCNNYNNYYCDSRISLRCEAETCATSLQFNSTSNSYQLAQIYVDNSWFYICPDSFTKSDADVICRNSGLTDSVSFGHVLLENLTQVYPISPNSYACTGNESSLCSCPSDTSTCNSITVVNVLCHEPNNGSIRLSNGYNGYVEVYNGEWKLVCDHPFNSIEADIICRSAGFRRAESFSPLYYYFYYLTDGNTINNVRCFGNETSLLDCSYSDNSECYDQSNVTCEKDGCESLLRNPESLEAVQIYIDQWYSMCEDNFTQQTADIICRENHHRNASNYTFLPIQPFNYPISPFYFQCDGNENSVCACEMIPQQCSSNRIVHIQCRKPSDGHLRLSNGTSGFLEVYLDGWKRVCGRDYNSISQAVSNVACRYLGYRDAITSNNLYTNYATNNIFPNPQCFGNETNILECVYDLATTCYYESYISCRTEGCQSYIFGKNTSDQPVRMYMNENWYYLCSNSISTKEADVICRENGFLNGADSISYIHKSQLTTRYEIYPYNITCNGNESSLCDCSMMQMQCTEGNIAEIRCSQSDQGTLRYSDLYSDVLEIFYNGGWSYICPYSWSTTDSTVACRQLGFTSSVYYSYYYYTTSIATPFLNNFQVSCNGNESSIIDCSHTNDSCYTYSSLNYHYTYYLSLYCTRGDCEVHAPFATERFQIVEYFINQQRYYLCADGFTRQNADVVCRETSGTLSITIRSISLSDLPLNTQIYPLQHFCFGNESSICNCTTSQQSCLNGSVAEVQCGTPEQEQIRLTSQNKLLFYYNQWRDICSQRWDTGDSDVACRQLGYRNSVSSALINNYYYNNLDNFVTDVTCFGNETRLSECRYHLASHCNSGFIISLTCQPDGCESYAPNAASYPQIVRYYSDGWYHLCGDGFTQENADVVCRENEGSTALSHSNVSNSDPPSGLQILERRFTCMGRETSLCDCSSSIESCPSNDVVQLQCNTPAYGHIRLANKDSGVLEIYLNQWGYVCDDGWNRIASEVVCKQLGLGRLISFETEVEVNNLLYPFLIDDVECNGNESTIFECTHTLRHDCASGEHVSITCGSDQITSTSTISTTSAPTSTTTSTPNTTTTSTPTSTTASTLTTSTTTVPTTSTTISTSTFMTTSSSIGIAPKIASPRRNITKTLNEIDTDIPGIECTATGDPIPDIYWSRDLKTKFINSSKLQINITDLSTDRVFYCVAENSAGRDVVSVTFKIVLTTEEITNTLDGIMDDLDEADSISDDKSGQTADMIKVVIDASNDNVDIEGEEKNKILENAAMTAQIIVEKTDGTFSNETTESITDLLSAIVNGSSDMQESESTVPQQREESTVATVPSALAVTLNTLERFSQRLSEELANSEVNSVKTVVSQLITIVVQNVELESSEDGETKTDIELPMKNSDDVEYSVMITLSTNLAAVLSTNGKSLAIATSIVKRIGFKESDSGQATQGSDILTVALAGKSGIVELTENVKFAFDVYSNQPSESTCVFLNGTSWVSDGLSTDQETSILTNCMSSHFTSFAVFVTLHDSIIPPKESIALSAISYLFVGISFIFLLISLILFLIAGKAFFKVEANIIYFNYCLSMLLATGLFIFGIQVGTYNIVLCQIIAFLLHYSWLAVFTWTLCIGILIMYKIVINVLSTKKIYKYLIIFGWGFPLIIPLITIAVAQDQYVDVSSHCFLNVTGGVIWAFIGPILIMILINAVFLIIALIRIIRVQSSAQNSETRNIVKNALITGLVLTPVLGLPWLILIFNVTIQHSVLEWLFIIINGAMGFVFFLVVVLRNKEVFARFKRNKRTAFSNTHQSSQQTAPSSSTPSGFTSNRFKKTNTIERHLVKESEIQGASIEQSEICKSPYETMDYQNNIYEVEKLEAATPGKADENMTGYDNPFYTSDALDDPPVYHNLSNKEMVTEVMTNPMYMQSPSAGYTNELYSTVADVTESDTQACFNPDKAET